MNYVKVFIITLIFLATVLFQGCVYKTSNQVAKIQEIPTCCLHKSCELKGQVVGESIYSFLDVGMQIAKDKAKSQAYKIGATHVVWQDLKPGVKHVAVAKAYRCVKRR